MVCFVIPCTGSSVYRVVGALIKQRPSVFNGKIVQYRPWYRDRTGKFDFGIEVKKSLYSALHAESERSTRFQCTLVPFSIALMQELEVLTILGEDAYKQKGIELVANHVSGLALEFRLKALFSRRYMLCALSGQRVVLSSFRPRDWKANAVEAIRKSLNGQLRGQDAPVVCVRFNNLSDQQRDMIFWGELSLSREFLVQLF